MKKTAEERSKSMGHKTISEGDTWGPEKKG